MVDIDLFKQYDVVSELKDRLQVTDYRIIDLSTGAIVVIDPNITGYNDTEREAARLNMALAGAYRYAVVKLALPWA